MPKVSGYDIDGVITLGFRPKVQDVLITGRSYQEAPETYSMLRKLGIFNAVYFYPGTFEDKTLESSGVWKAFMIKKLRVSIFYEDNDIQYHIIKRLVISCDVIKVG